MLYTFSFSSHTPSLKNCQLSTEEKSCPEGQPLSYKTKGLN